MASVASRKHSLATLQQRLVRAPKVAHGDGKVHVALHAQQVVPVVLPHMVIVIHNHHSSIHCRQSLPETCICEGPPEEFVRNFVVRLYGEICLLQMLSPQALLLREVVSMGA